jgi:hypothetical protein
MIIGVITANINFTGIYSLKDKRSIVKSLNQRLRNNFNLSAAEVGAHDSKRTAQIGIATVSNDSKHVNSKLDKINSFINADPRFFVSTLEREIFSSDA